MTNTLFFIMIALTSTLFSNNEPKIIPTQDTTQISCDVLQDAFVWSLFKPINKVLAEHNDTRQFTVDNVVELKRLSQGQYYWETTVQVSTFSGAHNPPYRYYTITFTNLFSDEPKAVRLN